MANYPWPDVQPGQGFFIPCLDTAKVRREGLRAAAQLQILATAHVALRKGRYGVWFFRPTARPVRSGGKAGSRFV